MVRQNFNYRVFERLDLCQRFFDVCDKKVDQVAEFVPHNWNAQVGPMIGRTLMFNGFQPFAISIKRTKEIQGNLKPFLTTCSFLYASREPLPNPVHPVYPSSIPNPFPSVKSVVNSEFEPMAPSSPSQRQPLSSLL